MTTDANKPVLRFLKSKIGEYVVERQFLADSGELVWRHVGEMAITTKGRTRNAAAWEYQVPEHYNYPGQPLPSDVMAAWNVFAESERKAFNQGFLDAAAATRF